MIAFHFPPMGGAGMLRTLKFTKFMPQLGWLPVVLTVRSELVGPQQENQASLLADFPTEGSIARTYLFNPKRFYNNLFVQDVHFQSSDGRILPGLKPSSAIASIKKSIRSLLFIPDSINGWLPFAIWQGVRLVRQNDIDVIFSTSDPYTDHLIGLVISRLTGKPWVADFRDPWTQDPSYEFRGTVREQIDKYLERVFVMKPNQVVVTTNYTRKKFLDMYTSLSPDKVVVITNGFDPGDFQGLCEERFYTRDFTVFYGGRLYEDQRGDTGFFEAIRKLLDNNPNAEDSLKLQFVGTIGQDRLEVIRDLRLDKVFEHLGYVSHREYLERAMAADVLLMINNVPEPSSDLCIPGKLFEYLAVGKPILALISEGDSAQIIRETGSGKVVHPQDVKRIQQALETLYRQRCARAEWMTEPSALRRYHHEQLTARLCQVLNQVARQVEGRNV